MSIPILLIHIKAKADISQQWQRNPSSGPLLQSGGLIIARCDVKGSTCSLDDLATREDREDYRLALGTFALKSNPGAQQVLVNFDNAQGTVMILASKDTRNSSQQIAKSS